MGADHVIPELALRAIRREDPFRVYGSGQRRAFCHVADAVEATLRLGATEGAWGQVVNIGNDTEETAIEDLAGLILRTARHRPAMEHLPAAAGSVERRCPDLTRLRALTGFTPKVPLETGVAETLDWYRAWAERGGARS
jgi:UDP-glucose 4-epimerase/UDP-glucuronate decarboxylase